MCCVVVNGVRLYVRRLQLQLWFRRGRQSVRLLTLNDARLAHLPSPWQPPQQLTVTDDRAACHSTPVSRSDSHSVISYQPSVSSVNGRIYADNGGWFNWRWVLWCQWFNADDWYLACSVWTARRHPLTRISPAPSPPHTILYTATMETGVL